MENTKGFSKGSLDIIEELEDFGWTFRRSTQGHAIGKAPDGVTTCSIPKVLSRANRSQQNTDAILKAWRRKVDLAAEEAHLDAVVHAIEATREVDPVIDGVLAASANKKATAALETLSRRSDSEPKAVAHRTPWRARKGTSRVNATADQYESHAVNIVTFTDGTSTFECAFRCGFVDPNNPRSVAAHYSTHVRKGEAPGGGERPVVAEDVPIDPATIRAPKDHEYTPTDRLLTTLAAFLDSHGMDTPEQAARWALTWMHDRPDLPDPEPQVHVPLTDAEKLDRIRLLVGGRDLVLEEKYAEAIAEADRLARECDRLNDVLSTLSEMAKGEVKPRS
jgi:hypothetical protein